MNQLIVGVLRYQLYSCFIRHFLLRWKTILFRVPSIRIKVNAAGISYTKGASTSRSGIGISSTNISQSDRGTWTT